VTVALIEEARMTLDGKAAAALAAHRFGMGPRPGTIAALAGDPRGALLAELDRPGIGQIVDPSLPSAAEAARALFEDVAARQARKVTAERAKKAAEASATMVSAEADNAMMAAADPQADPPLAQQAFRREAQVRFDAAFGCEIGFAERLVWFWSNHFCISADAVAARAGGYEREAIRPHVLGSFHDLLLAVESHPAMLVYLDNAASVGPDSVPGINLNRGINENLAREIMELHTLGVRTGYTQEDVIHFANVLTGWTVLPHNGNPEHGGEFVFNYRIHQPGAQTVLGKRYDEAGIEQGRAALADLARHPATADHVAAKLARHFVGETPPPALVERLAARFRDTDGDLKAVAKALILSPEAWAAPRDHLKRPGEWLLAMLRAAEVRPGAARMLEGLNLLGEPLWRPPAPKGFDDDPSVWIDGLARRLDIASAFAARNAATLAPDQVLEAALGPLASAETRETVARAESREQALALLVMSPEFLRR
jgi:uncharacterized protein (DUF1800 family)